MAVLAAVAISLTGCVVEAEDDTASQVRYDYTYLTYCDGGSSAYADCYDMHSTTYIIIVGDYSRGNTVVVKAYFGPEKGEISDTYTSYGVTSEGYLRLSNSYDTMDIYADYATVRAYDNSYYWSFSNYEDMY